MINQIQNDVLKLLKSLNKSNDALKILEILNKTDKAYLVGGCVRDIYMKDIPHDYDMCTGLLPNEIIKTMEENGYKASDRSIKYGTVIVTGYNKEEYEVTTFRSESNYSDSRHPSEVKFEKDVVKDLERRDFTINAIAYNPHTKEIVDPFNGVGDIKKGIIKAVGNPYERFNEDALRILRAMRFAIKYDFEIEEETQKAMIFCAPKLNSISKERITEEFKKIFETGKPVTDIFLKNSEIIKTIIPEIEECIGFNQNNKYHKHNVYEHNLAVTDLCKSNKFEIKMAALLHDIGKPQSYTVDNEGNGHFYGHPKVSRNIATEVLAKDFCVTTKEKERILDLVEFHDMEFEPTENVVKRKLNRFGEDFLRDWIVIKTADRDDHIFPYGKENTKWYPKTESIEEILNEVIEKNNCFSIKDLAINGNDLIQEFGLKPGKEIGNLLNNLLDEVIDNNIKNTKEDLLNKAKGLVNKSNGYFNENKYKNSKIVSLGYPKPSMLNFSNEEKERAILEHQ